MYLDTQIFVYYSLTRYVPRFSQIAKSFLQKIEKGKYEGVVSMLAIMELIKVIRSVCVQEMGEYDSKIWKDRISRVITAILKMKNIKLVEGSPEERVGIALIKDLLHSEIVWEGYEIIDRHPGSVQKISRTKFRHKGLSCVDSLHLVLAKKVGCRRIATFDKGFEESRDVLEPVILQKDIW